MDVCISVWRFSEWIHATDVEACVLVRFQLDGVYVAQAQAQNTDYIVYTKAKKKTYKKREYAASVMLTYTTTGN